MNYARTVRPLVIVVALVALLLQAGCSSMGLAMAEDVTRIGGALTGQQKTADDLADRIAAVRERQEEFDRKLEFRTAQLELQQKNLDEDLARQVKQEEKDEEEEKRARDEEVPPVAYGGLALALSAGLDMWNDRRRDLKHGQKDAAMIEALRAVVAPRAPRRAAASTDDDPAG